MRSFLLALLSGIVCAVSIPSVFSHAQTSSNVTVVASGLEGPRGLKFGPDGNLYVAEAGTGGSTSTAGECPQVVPPIGPYTNGNTGRISKIDKSGNRVTVASGFPSSVSSDATKDTSSVGDVAFLDGHLYAVLAGGGCSHGASVPNGIVRVDVESGSWKVIADLSQFLESHPVSYPDAADFEPDGTFYSLIAHEGRLYTVEPNHGQILSISTGGEIEALMDVSKSEGHIVPTSILARGDKFLLGNLNTFPIVPTSAKVMTLSHDDCRSFFPGLDPCDGWHTLKVDGSRAGFATVVAIAMGPDDLLYVLELSNAAGYPTPGAGKVVRVSRSGEIEDVATGLVVPTGMTFGPDGKLYVSNFGAAPAGAGQIVRISVN